MRTCTPMGWQLNIRIERRGMRSSLICQPDNYTELLCCVAITRAIDAGPGSDQCTSSLKTTEAPVAGAKVPLFLKVGCDSLLKKWVLSVRCDRTLAQATAL